MEGSETIGKYKQNKKIQKDKTLKTKRKYIKAKKEEKRGGKNKKENYNNQSFNPTIPLSFFHFFILHIYKTAKSKTLCIFESVLVAPYLTEIDSKILLPEFTGCLGTGSVVVNFLVLHVHSVLL